MAKRPIRTMSHVLFSMVASAQEDPLAWFPLQVGSHWVYETRGKIGRPEPARRGPLDHRGNDHWGVTIPEGLVVLREVKQQQQGNTHGAYLITRNREPYLVHGNCVYVIDGWDGQRQQLRPEYLKYLNEGARLTRFLFPFADGPRVGEQ